MPQEGEFEGFRIEEVLSRSGTTTVYRAFQHSLRRPVIIKELRPELAQDLDMLERFKREAQVCALIKHENIVDIYDYSVRADRIFLVMEFVTGCSLLELIQKNPRPPFNLILAILFQTLRGLSYAHSKGVIHRDLKPSNILLSRDGLVKITDLGLALLEGSAIITQPGAVVGTPAYISPEAISGRAITAQSDLFSLGVTFYELAAGQRAFYSEHFSETLKRVLSQQPQSLTQIQEDLPPEFDRLIMRMLEKQPAKRWSSAGEILLALQNLKLPDFPRDSRQVIREYFSQPAERSRTIGGAPAKSHFTDPFRRKTLLPLGLAAAFALIIAYLALKYQLPSDKSSETKENPTAILSQDTASLASPPSDSTALTGTGASRFRDALPDTTKRVQDRVSPKPMESTFPSVVPETLAFQGGLAQQPVQSPKQPEADQYASAEPALLRVRCEPWADVFLNDVMLDRTPFESRSLPSGRYRLSFHHPAFPPVFRDIDVKPGEELTVNVSLWETVGRIVVLVDSWAEVYIDDILAGVTPLREPLIVPLGRCVVTLKNPAFAAWKDTLAFQRGDPPCTLRVKLESDHGPLSNPEISSEANSDSSSSKLELPADSAAIGRP